MNKRRLGNPRFDTLHCAEKDSDGCTDCGSCEEIVACPSGRVGYVEGCVGCGACHLACPNEAIKMRESPRVNEISIKVNGETLCALGNVTVKKALELVGYVTCKFPDEDCIFVPCEVGGCWSCAVETNSVHPV